MFKLPNFLSEILVGFYQSTPFLEFSDIFAVRRPKRARLGAACSHFFWESCGILHNFAKTYKQ